MGSKGQARTVTSKEVCGEGGGPSDRSAAGDGRLSWIAWRKARDVGAARERGRFAIYVNVSEHDGLRAWRPA